MSINHDSDCATHNGPAEAAGDCDCSLAMPPPNGIEGVLAEMARIAESEWPVSGGDVMSIMIHHGVATKEQCDEAVKLHAPELWENINHDPGRPDASLDDNMPF